MKMKLAFRIILLLNCVFCTLYAQETGNLQNSILRWAADSESGAPFAFVDPQNVQKMKGFEVDIINALAAKINKTPQFIQNAWDGLIPAVLAGHADLAINGIEITPQRKKEVLFTSPYYFSGQQLVVRKTEQQLTSLEKCLGCKVGTIKFSLAHDMLLKMPKVQVVTYESEMNAYDDLNFKRIDAVFMDWPIALYHAKARQDLKFSGEIVGDMYYGIAVAPQNKDLWQNLELALDQLKKSGELQKILQNWDLWNEKMQDYALEQGWIFSKTRQEAAVGSHLKNYQQHQKSEYLKQGFEKIKDYVRFAPLILLGAARTMQISILSMMLAVAFGLLLALWRLYASPFWRFLSVIYIEAIRGTPLLIQLMLIYYGLPHLGLHLAPLSAAILGLGFNYAAYEAENYRAGLQSLPVVQMESAISLGLTKWQAVRFVLIPQAMKQVLPITTNDFIALIKDSSLVSVITMVELTKVYGQISSTNFDYLGTGIVIAVVYFLLGWPFVRLSRFFETRIRV